MTVEEVMDAAQRLGCTLTVKNKKMVVSGGDIRNRERIARVAGNHRTELAEWFAAHPELAPQPDPEVCSLCERLIFLVERHDDLFTCDRVGSRPYGKRPGTPRCPYRS